MKMLIFSVYDTKTKAYMMPFFSHTAGSAIRSFTDAAGEDGSIVALHPADYHLYQIGDWDDEKGLIGSHEPHALGSADSYLAAGADVQQQPILKELAK